MQVMVLVLKEIFRQTFYHIKINFVRNYCSDECVKIMPLFDTYTGTVVISGPVSMFLSPATAVGAGLYSISMYGGLVVFGGYLLYDTQQIIHMAETYPSDAIQPYDPVNASISIYLDTLNIFIRIAILLNGGDSRKK